MAADPASVKKLIGLGAEVTVESGAGLASDIADSDFEAAGARIVPSSGRNSALAEADLVVRVQAPTEAEIAAHQRGALHVSFLDPFNHPELLTAFAQAGVNAVSLEFIPRTTLAQKMDALSSQANLAGYVAVVLAAERLNRILPMLMTPAGTLSPARYFIIGAGVAGLQAIATAKRLGARVDAFDTRPVVAEQVRSLGGKFVEIDIGETGQTEQGYAKELTAEQLEMQRQGMAKVCAQSDVVITTAKLFGRKAPIVITRDMVAGMKRGSIIIDLAAESGGNVEGTVPGEETLTENGVRIVGLPKLEAHVSQHASQVFAANIANFIEHFWDKEAKTFSYRMEDEILKSSLMTHDGSIVQDRFKKA
ncbi:MAG: NAD(P) transhydrogenase subunit alpha [Verrucomicrobiales bacterium]|nr:NAD(P) transhydrogenase subunit alpha [Verrucomicrobiales bacterium]